eukprot:1238425-Lingulodinium_polyedra.AAC.1
MGHRLHEQFCARHGAPSRLARDVIVILSNNGLTARGADLTLHVEYQQRMWFAVRAGYLP